MDCDESDSSETSFDDATDGVGDCVPPQLISNRKSKGSIERGKKFISKSKKGGRPSDSIWKHFKRDGPSKTGTHYVAVCRYCETTYKRGKVDLMRSHIAFACSTAPTKAKEDVRAVLGISVSSNDPSETKRTKLKIQTEIGQYFTCSQTLGREAKQYIDCELVKFLIGCNIPFSVVQNPFFVAFMEALRPGYKPPSKSHVSDSLFWEETARVVRNSETEISQDTLVTLAMDGWTDGGKSLYAFNVITTDRRIYLHALKDFSEERQTAAFLTSETLKVIEEIGAQKVAALVTDNAANVKKVCSEIRVKYPHILNIRCIPHFINLITEDIMNHEWAVSVLKTCQSVVTYFGSHHQFNALLAQCRSSGEQQLSGYVNTRWYSAGTCIQSVLSNENALRLLVRRHETEISEQIQAIVGNHQFWADCNHILTILQPLMSVVGSLESNTATLADCYQQLITLAASINNVSGPADFTEHCMAAYSRRWTDLDDSIYKAAYFLHPGMRGKGMAASMFGKIAETAAELWKDLGNGKQSTMKLLSQIMKYKSGEPPYNLPYAGEFLTPNLWWESTEDVVGSELKTLAVRLLSVTPHSAACERTFSILGWIHSKCRNRLLVSRLEAMGKVYLYYASKQNNYRCVTPIKRMPETTLETYYGEDDDSADVMSECEVVSFKCQPNDQAVWTGLKGSFDLAAFAGRVQMTAIKEEAEDEVTLNETDDRDFNVHELAAMYQQSLDQKN